MSYSAFDWLSASELSKLLERREVSPVDIVDAMLKRASALQPHLNALVLIDGDSAQAAARLQNPVGRRASRFRRSTVFRRRSRTRRT
jgi:Asp-tRNA(Asn)/Glu-tRNA(Gln) amidotransferase A subunit family amidase